MAVKKPAEKIKSQPGKSARPERPAKKAAGPECGDKRGSKETAEKIEQALELITEGDSVRKACEAVGLAKTTFLKYVDSDQYARARDAQVEAQFEEMNDLEARCLEHKLDPKAFRAVMESRKWRFAKIKPAVYGDKVGVEHSGSLSIVWSNSND